MPTNMSEFLKKTCLWSTSLDLIRFAIKSNSRWKMYLDVVWRLIQKLWTMSRRLENRFFPQLQRNNRLRVEDLKITRISIIKFFRTWKSFMTMELKYLRRFIECSRIEIFHQLVRSDSTTCDFWFSCKKPQKKLWKRIFMMFSLA